MREVLPGSDAASPLEVEFALISTADELRDKLGGQAWDVLHCYEHDRTLLTDNEQGRPNQLQVVNRFYAELADDSSSELRAPSCALLTETSARPGRETAPVPGIPVTLRMSGSLEDPSGAALAFISGFYGALAAGLSLSSAVSEGRASAASASAEGPFEATMFEAGQRVVARARPFDELRRLKQSARQIADSLRAVQRQLSQSSRLSAGDLLGERFVLEEQVVAGRFTEIWKAYDREARNVVAVKVLHEAWARAPRCLARYEQAAIAMDELAHPRVVQIVKRVQSDRLRRSFFVMRWYEGGDLGQAVRQGTLERDAALLVCADAFEGLAEAHKRRLVHRDVTPGHVLIDGEGRGCIADFDLELGDNQWGMHDILGNVWEWCEDGPRTYANEAIVDPLGPMTHRAPRVVRGGGWHSSRSFGVRAADRMAIAPNTTDKRVGFRLARHPD